MRAELIDAAQHQLEKITAALSNELTAEMNRNPIDYAAFRAARQAAAAGDVRRGLLVQADAKLRDVVEAERALKLAMPNLPSYRVALSLTRTTEADGHSPERPPSPTRAQTIVGPTAAAGGVGAAVSLPTADLEALADDDVVWEMMRVGSLPAPLLRPLTPVDPPAPCPLPPYPPLLPFPLHPRTPSPPLSTRALPAV